MSGGFNFGQASSTGFSFGAPKTTAATAPATGFGMPSAAAPGGGFSFGTPSTPQAPGSTNPTGGFSFGTPAQSSTPAGGGFSFGTPIAKLNLGTPVASQPALTGLTMGMATPSSGTGFGLGGGLATQTTAAPAGGGFSFGAAGGLGAPVAQTQPQTQPAAAGGLSLGTPAEATQIMGGGFSFGAAKVQATTAPAPTVTVGGGFSFGNSTPASLSLGTQPTTTPAPTATAPATQASLGSSLFAVPASTAAPATAAITGFLGAAPTSAAPAATSTAGSTLGFMLKPLGAVTATTTAPVGTGTIQVHCFIIAPPVMSYIQLEGLINKWSLELEDQERHFLQQATQVNAWDRTLVENGEKITSLHREMEKVKLDQRRLDQELDFILSQQKELEDLLSPLEESVKEQSGTIYMQNADEERERTYKLAENVDAQLKRMSQDLKEIIEHLNTSSGPADNSDPLQQICKILNAHMDSLQWIDQNSVLLQRRVEDVSKLCDNRRKEQEKTFRITFH
uniref:Nuclear pore glycoprotein p62 n=1 Tax=Oncorhynchus tshawytscha TaxID=74940 RepID=A0A8C8EWU0_ONCTS